MSACVEPLAPQELADYWFGDLAAADVERVEEHLLGCGACSGRLAQLVSFGEGVRLVAARGGVQVVVTPSFLQAAAKQGLRTREYSVAPGERVACTVTPEDDLLVSRLVADFSGVSSVEVWYQFEGQPEQRIEDVPVHPAARELLVSQAMPALRALGPAVVRLRLLAGGEGEQRLLGEYVFNHTPKW